MVLPTTLTLGSREPRSARIARLVASAGMASAMIVLAGCGEAAEGGAELDKGSAPGAGAGSILGTSGAEGPTAASDAAGGPEIHTQEGWVLSDSPAPGRMAEITLPGDAEGEDAQLVVRMWPGGIGPLESNVDMWVGQVGLDIKGADLTPEQRWTAEPGEFFATLVHVEGAVASTHGMASDTPKSDDAAILAAFIEKPGSPDVWTAKIMGPSKTVRAHRDRFLQFIEAL